MNKNEVITLSITDINSEGAGVGRYNGQVVFVPYALPDEVVEVLIIKVSKNYCVGKIVNIIEASPLRTEPVCPYFFRCGGCDLQHVDYKSQLKLKCESTIKNIKKISDTNIEIDSVIGSDKIWNYRNKAQYPISRDNNNEVAIGFFSPRSHRIVSIDTCLLQDEKCNMIIEATKKAINKHHIEIYDEIKHKGVLRHVIARASAHELMVILVTNSTNDLPQDFINTLKESVPSITTIIQNYNCQKGNIILGSKCKTLLGKGYINDCICNIHFKLGPLAFLQINHDQAEKLYNKVLELASLTGNEIVFDAYCGIGIMSLMLSKKSKKLIGVEIVDEAIKTARETAKLNDIHNAEFITGACETVLPQLLKNNSKPDVLVVDPPRAGCDASLLRAINEADIKKIVYVSCDPATLARDINILNSYGYSCCDVTFVDMFCHTKHIESVVCLSK